MFTKFEITVLLEAIEALIDKYRSMDESERSWQGDSIKKREETVGDLLCRFREVQEDQCNHESCWENCPQYNPGGNQC